MSKIENIELDEQLKDKIEADVSKKIGMGSIRPGIAEREAFYKITELLKEDKTLGIKIKSQTDVFNYILNSFINSFEEDAEAQERLNALDFTHHKNSMFALTKQMLDMFKDMEYLAQETLLKADTKAIAQLNNKDAEIQALEEHLRTIRMEKAELDFKSLKWEEKQAQLQQELDNTREELESVSKLLVNIEGENSKLNLAIKEGIVNYRTLENELKDALKDGEALAKEVDSLTNKNSKLEQELHLGNVKYNTLKDSIATLEEDKAEEFNRKVKSIEEVIKADKKASEATLQLNALEIKKIKMEADMEIIKAKAEATELKNSLELAKAEIISLRNK